MSGKALKMTLPPEPADVWFLTGSQALYGPQTLVQVADQSRQVAEALDASGIGARVIWKPVLTTADEILTVLRAANSSVSTDRMSVGR